MEAGSVAAACRGKQRGGLEWGGADQTGREEARGKEVQAIGERRLLVGEKLKYQ